MRYIVLQKAKRQYLTNDYYKPQKKFSYLIEKAHKFSAFELLLASKTILCQKNLYEVYQHKNLIEILK